MNEVIILRGVPGSGKSTFIKKFYPEATVVSADKYFHDPETGEYNFDPTKLHEAHHQCQVEFKRAVAKGVRQIVVDNTNIRLSEFKPYFDHALEHGYRAKGVYIHSDPEIAAERNIHKVPKELVIRKFAQIEHDPEMAEAIYWDGEYLEGAKEWDEPNESQNRK